MDKLQRNFRLLYALEFFLGFSVFAALVNVFFIDEGLSQTQVTVIQSIFTAAVVLWEVPSGYFADRFGRRLSILIGSILMPLGFGAYFLAHGFWQFIVAEIMLAIGLAFISGANTALAKDSQLLLGLNDDEYDRYFHRSQFIKNVSGLGGALLATVFASNIRLSLLAEAIFLLPMIPLAFFLVETPIKRKKSAAAWRDVLSITKWAIHGNRPVRSMIFYAAVLSALTHTMFWVRQPLLLERGVPVEYFGVIMAGLSGLVALTSLSLTRLVVNGHRRRALVLLPVLGIGTYVALVALPQPQALILLANFSVVQGATRGLMDPLRQKYVPSEARAAVGSVDSMVRGLVYIVLNPAIGFLYDLGQSQLALAGSAVIYSALCTLAVRSMRRANLL